MAKVKKRAPAKRRSKKRSKGHGLGLQLLKIFGGIAILLVLVIGGGLLVRFVFIQKPAVQPKTAARPPQRTPVPLPEEKPVPAPEAKPVYEVFSKSSPPAKPIVELPPIPGDHPPVVAIIFDDIGYDRQKADRLLSLDVPLTFSMLPYGPFSRQIMVEAQSKGIEVMLHLPMEPDEYPAVKPGPGALLSTMSPDELIHQLDADLDQFSGLKGVNNHMGSKLSTSPERLRQIFSILKKRGLYYIDSRTTAETVAEPSARLLHLPFAERDIFIDHVDDPAFIHSQLLRLVKRAKHQGYAVGIAHPHENTYRVLREFLPELKAEVTLVPASMVVQRVTAANESDKIKAASR